MKLCTLLSLLTLIAAIPAFAGDKVVELTQGQHSIIAKVNGEVFTVFRYSPDQAKPYFHPVAVPGSIKLLDKADPSDDEWDPGRKVFVVAEEAPLKVEKEQAATVKYGDILEVGKIEGNWLWIPDRQGWIRASDVAPVAGLVTRLIDETPSKTKDRKDPAYYDHPHHKGIWFTLDEVNGKNYWMEKARVTTRSVEIVTPSGNPAVFKVINDWEGDDKHHPVLEQTTLVSIYANGLLTYDATLAAASKPVTLNDTKEGMFAIRLPNSMREMVGGGPVTSSEGATSTKDSWGLPARWINYDGPVDGQILGVTIMDDPQNPWPSRYHVRDYGLFAVNPFGEGSYTEKSDKPAAEKTVTLNPNQPLRFRFGLWVHGKGATSQSIEKVFEQFASTRP